MGRQPTMLLIAVAFGCAASAKWVVLPALSNSARPAGTHLPGVATAPKPANTDSSAHSSGTTDSAALASNANVDLKLQRNTLIPSAHLFTDFSHSDEPNAVTKPALSPTPDDVLGMLAEQGIAIPGIDESSSHEEALFVAYFDQSGAVSNHALDIILGDWAKTHPAEAWHWIESNDLTGVLHSFRDGILQHWLPHDAHAALLAVTSLAPSVDKDRLLAEYASFLAQEEPDSAFYWAYGLADERSRRKVLDRVVYEWASSNPELVIHHLDSILEPDIRKQLLFQAGPAITSNLIQTDAYQAMQWTDTLTGEEQAFLSPIAFQQWVNKNPEAAIGWLTVEKNGVDSERYMASAATSLAYQNLPVAMQVFPAMNTNVQQNMASSIAFSLYQVDSNEAKLWSNNLSDSTVQRRANQGILKASVDNEPELALQMALEYVGPDQTKVLVNTAIEVDQQHPDLMEAWLAIAPIDEAQLFDIRAALVRSPVD